MAIIKVKPQVGEIACAHYPAFLDKYHNPMSLMYVGVIKWITKKNEVLIKDAPFAIPEWRIEWFTFGNIPVVNPRFNIIKINNENDQLIKDQRKQLKKN